MMHFLVTVIAAALPLTGASAAAEDAKGCKDHQLFTRMANFDIYSCDSAQFDAVEFPKAGLKTWTQPEHYDEIEGKVFHVSYKQQAGAAPATSLQIVRNFQNAASAAGGTILGDFKRPLWPNFPAGMKKFLVKSPGGTLYDRMTTLKLTRGQAEYWVIIAASDDYHDYAMTIVEREAMKQEVAVNELVDRLNKDGFLTLYVNFETNKAAITPDSAQTLDQAASVLAAAPSIAVTIAGHTDNVGTPEANQKLSEERARAVMSALLQRGIAAARMEARGYGQTMPVADNRTEDGRAKNRRVELVKK